MQDWDFITVPVNCVCTDRHSKVRCSDFVAGLYAKVGAFGSLDCYFAGGSSCLDETLQGQRSSGHRCGQLSAQGPPEA